MYKEIFISLFVAGVIAIFGAIINGKILSVQLSSVIDKQKEIDVKICEIEKKTENHGNRLTWLEAKADNK